MKLDIKILRGDITQIHCDAIVNAANETLLGGGGVDGAIHRAAGKELLEFCRKLKGCRTGQAKISPGFDLKAKYVIHTVGPVWRGGDKNEQALLRSCYQNCMKIAEENKIAVMAFPAISTGVYGYPKEQAAETAISAVNAYKSKNGFPREVLFVCYSKGDEAIYGKLLGFFSAGK
ncbi:O-acetyl-ADP-ribose deacetylase [candidate division WOR-3 bacterium]|nr:O-acetyl-ADP-ribose deacetylase [candidate division WOR-3 bacterium]